MTAMKSLPFSVGKVTLTVQDLDRVSAFYQQAVGLHLLKGDAATAELGVEGRTLLELRRDTTARRRSPRSRAVSRPSSSVAIRSRPLDKARDGDTPAGRRCVGSQRPARHSICPSRGQRRRNLCRPSASSCNGKTDRCMPSDPLDIDSVVASAGDRRWKASGRLGRRPCASAGRRDPARRGRFYNGILGHASPATIRAGPLCRRWIPSSPGNKYLDSRGAGERVYPSTGLANVEILASAEFIDPIRSRPIKPEPAYAYPQDLSLRATAGGTKLPWSRRPQKYLEFDHAC